MRRFVTVDSRRSSTSGKDFDVVHVMGFENSHEVRDTLYSLDIWRGRVRPEELLRQIYMMALKWGVQIVGVEAYPVLSEFYERVRDNLPSMYGMGMAIPRVIPIRFPTKMTKPDKIMQMEWRFRHYRLKLPADRLHEPAYKRLVYEIENFTEDMELLDHDDCIDTLAMHAAIGKQHQSAGPDIYRPPNLQEELREGHAEVLGVPTMSGLNASDLTEETLNALLKRKYDEAEDAHGPVSEWDPHNWGLVY
jgi:hypothetical protein